MAVVSQQGEAKSGNGTARYAIDLALSGSYYQGTAIQPAPIPTLHRHLAECCEQLAPGSGASVQCCSRLDAGVAASTFVVHVDLPCDWQPPALCKALNGLFRWPDHLRHATVLRAAVVADDWDAWRSSCSKTYHYAILVSPAPPLHHEHCLWLRRRPQIDILHHTAAQLLGRHNLSAFACLRKDPSDAFEPQRDIFQSAWNEQASERGWHLHYVVEGNGFLYKQVRGMVGAMLYCALNPSQDLSAFSDLIHLGRRAPRLGDIVAADGLCLSAIDYGNHRPAWQYPAPHPHSSTL